VRLSYEMSLARLESGGFAVLGTVDERRGVHLVPVIYVVAPGKVAIPIDRVKDKTTMRLRRIENLGNDPRASLLVDHRSDDWAELWWVRADLTFLEVERPARWAPVFADRFPPYVVAAAIESVLVLAIESVTGWQATR
jgi:PPOX class probable F420-dependent enzyme